MRKPAGIGREPGPTTGAAEVISRAGECVAMLASGRINRHAADRVPVLLRGGAVLMIVNVSFMPAVMVPVSLFHRFS